MDIDLQNYQSFNELLKAAKSLKSTRDAEAEIKRQEYIRKEKTRIAEFIEAARAMLPKPLRKYLEFHKWNGDSRFLAEALLQIPGYAPIILYYYQIDHPKYGYVDGVYTPVGVMKWELRRDEGTHYPYMQQISNYGIGEFPLALLEAREIGDNRSEIEREAERLNSQSQEPSGGSNLNDAGGDTDLIAAARYMEKAITQFLDYQYQRADVMIGLSISASLISLVRVLQSFERKDIFTLPSNDIDQSVKIWGS